MPSFPCSKPWMKTWTSWKESLALKTPSGSVSLTLSLRSVQRGLGHGAGPSPSFPLMSTVICHVVGITYQHIDRWLLAEMLGDLTGKAWVPRVSLGGWGWSGAGGQPTPQGTLPSLSGSLLEAQLRKKQSLVLAVLFLGDTLCHSLSPSVH